MSAKLSDDVAAVFADGGALSGAIGGFEPRDGQRRMADAVASVLDTGGTLLAEAGTGTGKTLAYLVPAILSGQRVLVSTGTKNLQEQIYFKDIPALDGTLGVSFTATLMKGRSNYLCLHRFQQMEGSYESRGMFEPEDVFDRRADESEKSIFLPVLREWAARTQTGDRAELADLPEDLALWNHVSATAETCLGGDCPQFSDCFVTRMRQRATESDVVIVNHHLLCADAAVRHGSFGEVIPSCTTLVVDEAHQLEDVATQYFGLAFSNYRIADFVHDAQRGLAAAATAQRLAESSGGGWNSRPIEDAARALTRVDDRARTFFARLSTARGPGAGQDSRLRYTGPAISDVAEDGLALAGALEAFEAALTLVAQDQAGLNIGPFDATPATVSVAATLAPQVLDAPGAAEALSTLQRRAGELHRDLRQLLRGDDPDLVYYLETRGRGVFLRASPVDVSRLVREALFDRFRTVVLTSATLAVDGSFAYVKGRLGLREADEILVPGEFDYASQALMYLPRRMPTPKSPSFAAAVSRETVEILQRTRGRAFVLFTSYAVLRAVQRDIELALPYPVLVQGQAPRSTLIQQFRSTRNAVLLATSSFWQGVDVVGEALSCVIVDKLPFASPGDPVTAARIDTITAKGGDAFGDYQVPLAILALQQGLGRLIRHRTDRGVLAVLDPRLRTTGYGRRFLSALPPAPVTHDLDAIARFFR
jgi:ATP-dependent DNA helicase DinG